MTRTIFPHSWLGAFRRKTRQPGGRSGNGQPGYDLLAHPELARMSLAEIADLPIDACLLPEHLPKRTAQAHRERAKCTENPSGACIPGGARI